MHSVLFTNYLPKTAYLCNSYWFNARETRRVAACSCSRRPPWLVGLLLPGGAWGSPSYTSKVAFYCFHRKKSLTTCTFHSGEVSNPTVPWWQSLPCCTHLSIVSLRVCLNNNPPPHTDNPPPLPHLRWQHLQVSWSAQEGDGVSVV